MHPPTCTRLQLTKKCLCQWIKGFSQQGHQGCKDYFHLNNQTGKKRKKEKDADLKWPHTRWWATYAIFCQCVAIMPCNGPVTAEQWYKSNCFPIIFKWDFALHEMQCSCHNFVNMFSVSLLRYYKSKISHVYFINIIGRPATSESNFWSASQWGPFYSKVLIGCQPTKDVRAGFESMLGCFSQLMGQTLLGRRSKKALLLSCTYHDATRVGHRAAVKCLLQGSHSEFVQVQVIQGRLCQTEAPIICYKRTNNFKG